MEKLKKKKKGHVVTSELPVFGMPLFGVVIALSVAAPVALAVAYLAGRFLADSSAAAAMDGISGGGSSAEAGGLTGPATPNGTAVSVRRNEQELQRATLFMVLASVTCVLVVRLRLYRCAGRSVLPHDNRHCCCCRSTRRATGTSSSASRCFTAAWAWSCTVCGAGASTCTALRTLGSTPTPSWGSMAGQPTPTRRVPSFSWRPC